MNNPKSAAAGIDEERLRADLESPNEDVRARAVRSLCPCHAGWKPFEKFRDAAMRLTKDESPLVRASARHIFEDAAEIESSGQPTNPREVTERNAGGRAVNPASAATMRTTNHAAVTYGATVEGADRIATVVARP